MRDGSPLFHFFPDAVFVRLVGFIDLCRLFQVEPVVHGLVGFQLLKAEQVPLELAVDFVRGFEVEFQPFGNFVVLRRAGGAIVAQRGIARMMVLNRFVHLIHVENA